MGPFSELTTMGMVKFVRERGAHTACTVAPDAGADAAGWDGSAAATAQTRTMHRAATLTSLETHRPASRLQRPWKREPRERAQCRPPIRVAIDILFSPALLKMQSRFSFTLSDALQGALGFPQVLQRQLARSDQVSHHRLRAPPEQADELVDQSAMGGIAADG